jgi:hypothetical protein
MKTYKSFVTEHGGTGSAIMKHDAAPVEDGNKNIANVSDPEVLKMVNAFVGSMADREYLNANHAISELRQKLMRIGITFPNVEIYEGEGDVTAPLTQYGGRYGNDGSGTADGQLVNDDGISHKVSGGLSINFKYMDLENGSCKVFAKIA